MRVLLKDRLMCGTCGTTMVHNDKNDSIRCPLFRCVDHNVECEMPYIEVKPVSERSEEEQVELPIVPAVPEPVPPKKPASKKK